MKKPVLTKTLVLIVVLAMTSIAGAAEPPLLGDVPDGSRATPLHLIPLRAEPLPGKEPDQIYPKNDPALPFSTKATCGGTCHSYNIITTGWHFNAVDSNIPPGRIGQPWILADPLTATVIPLSYRAWPGTFKPQQIGLTPMGFLGLFGRQMPGGGIGEMLDKTDNPDEILRVGITGQLEIDCLACHNINPGQDMGSAAGYAIQIIRGNYRWAATASSEFAYVTGSTKGLPESYDFREPFVSSDSKAKPPVVEYDKGVFGHNDWVRFDVPVQILKQRCYFCHSSVDIHDGMTEKWTTDEDIHLAAGLSCVDCHRNGLQHNITRGYAGEPNDSNNVLAANSSCEGCHLGTESVKPTAGRFAAPVPKHPGIPPIHFEKLSCTACHSGPWPKAELVRTKTAQAHAIGVAGAKSREWSDILPHLVYPVFAKAQDGKIAPHKLFWPAYWATMDGNNITPFNMDTVKAATGKVITKAALSKVGSWPDLKEEDIAKVLAAIASEVASGARPVYIAAGKLYLLDEAGKLVSAENKIAAPYIWPIAHDVRPAAQSLGVRSCGDCHSTDSQFFFGLVPVDSPLKTATATGFEMVKFQDLPRFYTKAFAWSFIFRPWLKVVTLACCAVIAGILLLYALKALYFVARILVGREF